MKIQETPVENVDYIAYGAMRSGNHAIINWILRHFDSFIFYNCCSVKDAGLVSVENFNVFKFGSEPYKVRLASFEDELYGVDVKHDITPRIGNIIVLRDFYNTYASRFQKRRTEKSQYWQERTWYRYDDVSIWKRFAREFMGETNFTNAIKVNYNRWFSSKDYRESLSSNFGPFSDAGLNVVMNIAGGSSFDMLKCDGRAHEMRVLHRWTKYYNDKEFVEKILNDDEAKLMNRNIFGFSPPKIHI